MARTITIKNPALARKLVKISQAKKMSLDQVVSFLVAKVCTPSSASKKA